MEPEPLPRWSRTDGGLPGLAMCRWRSFGGRLQVWSYPCSRRLGVLLRFLRDSQMEPSRQLLLVMQGRAHKSKLVLDGVVRVCRVANYEEDSRDVPGRAQGQEQGGPDAAGQSPWNENRELHDRRPALRRPRSVRPLNWKRILGSHLSEAVSCRIPESKVLLTYCDEDMIGHMVEVAQSTHQRTMVQTYTGSLLG